MSCPSVPAKKYFNNHGVTGQLLGGWQIGWILDYEAGSRCAVQAKSAKRQSISGKIHIGTECNIAPETAIPQCQAQHSDRIAVPRDYFAGKC